MQVKKKERNERKQSITISVDVVCSVLGNNHMPLSGTFIGICLF